MILQSSDARRFQKLFLGLIDWLAPQFGLPSSPRFPCDRLSDPDFGTIFEGVWGKDGNSGLIDDFIHHNPLRLNRTNLREVEAWKDALFDSFFVARDGRDVVLMYGQHAFVVRGIEAELEDEMRLSLPTCYKTVILPFAGVLTYGMAGAALSLNWNRGQAEELMQEVARAKQSGKRVSSARDFAKALPIAIAEEEELREEDEWWDSEHEEDEPAPGQHVGVLAGLTPSERAAAVMEYEDKLFAPRTPSQEKEGYDRIREEIEEECVDGSFAWLLAQAIGKLDNEALRELAKSNGIVDERLLGQREELVQEVARVTDASPDALLRKSVLRGPWAVAEAKTLHKAGGVQRFFDSNKSVEDVPHSCFPILQIFHREHEFVCIMPREVMESLDHAMWDACEARAKALDDAFVYLETIQDMRGVVLLQDALEEINENVCEVSEEELRALVAERARMDQEGVQLCLVDGEWFFVEPVIVMAEVLDQKVLPSFKDQDAFDAELARLSAIAQRQEDIYEYVGELDHNKVRDILDGQQGKPSCPPSEDQLKMGVLNATMSTPEAQALVSYFDANVPDDEDDYYFATDAVRDIIHSTRTMPDMGLIFGRLRDLGFVPTKDQVQEVVDLLMDLIKVIPMWTNNGWTPAEVPVKEGSVRPLALVNFDIPVRD